MLVRHHLERHQDDQAPSHGAEIAPAITCGIADGVQHVVDQLLRLRDLFLDVRPGVRAQVRKVVPRVEQDPRVSSNVLPRSQARAPTPLACSAPVDLGIQDNLSEVRPLRGLAALPLLDLGDLESQGVQLHLGLGERQRRHEPLASGRLADAKLENDDRWRGCPVLGEKA